MPSHRRSYSRTPSRDSRSASPGARRTRRERKSRREVRDEEEEDNDHDPRSRSLPHGASNIDDDDYFLKNAEFRLWLKEEKDKYFDELSSDRARKYFHKFVKAWNQGKLHESYYSGVEVQPASSQTAYRWAFADKGGRNDRATLEATRKAVGEATRSQAPEDAGDSSPSAAGALTPQGAKRGRVHGPTLPSASDKVLMREAQEDEEMARRLYDRKRGRQDEKDKMEDMFGPKERGREGMLEKKKARREADRSAKDAKDDAFGDYDEGTLMGGGDSFKARIAQRDAARKRFEEKRNQGREDKEGAGRERREAFQAKEKATMEMFKQMAKERFGA